MNDIHFDGSDGADAILSFSAKLDWLQNLFNTLVIYELALSNLDSDQCEAKRRPMRPNKSKIVNLQINMTKMQFSSKPIETNLFKYLIDFRYREPEATTNYETLS